MLAPAFSATISRAAISLFSSAASIIAFDSSTFAIIDAFPDESGRQAHLAGHVASFLKEKGPQLLASEPTIERFDVLAAKLPVVALQH